MDSKAGNSEYNRTRGRLDTAEAQTSTWKISRKKLPRRKWSKTEIENENTKPGMERKGKGQLGVVTQSSQSSSTTL